jgi:ribose transport system ATP-binding protein
MSIADNITMSNLNGFGPLRFIVPKYQRQSVQKWIKNLDIRCHGPEQSIDDLSGGNQQKAVFARLLHHDVDLLLLDEPTRGIDVGSKAKIYEAINQLAMEVDEKGLPRKAVLVISSYMPELLGICDLIGVMYKGQLSDLKQVDQVDKQSLMAAATGQTAIG